MEEKIVLLAEAIKYLIENTDGYSKYDLDDGLITEGGALVDKLDDIIYE